MRIIDATCDFCHQVLPRQRSSVNRSRALHGGKYMCVSCYRKSKTAFKGTQIHTSYSAAKQRCTNPTNTRYKDYGGRGIRFLWKSFEDFYQDMSATHFENATIERIDVNGDYCKENCRWVPAAEQARNTTRNIHTAEKVKKIRELYSAGYTQVQLAKMYGDSQGNISNIIKERTWKNVYC